MPIFYGKVEEDMAPPPWDQILSPISPSRPVSPTLARARLDETHASPQFVFGSTREERPLSRGELIDRIKRRESQSPKWRFRHRQGTRTPNTPSPRPSPLASPESSLILEPPTQSDATQRPTTPTQDRVETVQGNEIVGMQIERPRSALHSGDFRSDNAEAFGTSGNNAFLPQSPPAPWAFKTSQNYQERNSPRLRTSLSGLSAIELLPSTSPLAQALSASDFDHRDSNGPSRVPSPVPTRDTRRHTFSPASFELFQSQCFDAVPSPNRSIPTLRRDGTYPFQAHQPRRSFTAGSPWSTGQNFQSPVPRSRGLSISGDASPLRQASLVGSFEESILRGRMSSTPSKPLQFIAQIGVSGRSKGNTKTKIPPHVTIPFQAVFHNYNGGNGRITDNQPSPYVGEIDLEHNLEAGDKVKGDRLRRRHHSPTVAAEVSSAAAQESVQMDWESRPSVRNALKRQELRKRSQSPRKTPVGGCYRIPQIGQLQVVLKTPTKNAMKVFLVPYDLSDMEPGTKTFIRQRSFSAGPIIDMPLDVRKNLGTDRPEAAISHAEDPRDRPVLRYLIHLHICCPSKGRYYLYKSIRVVFANRVPDGKEKLRVEAQLPEPKYSVYKAGRDSLSGPVSRTASPKPINPKQELADKIARRRSTQLSFAQQLRLRDTPQQHEHYRQQSLEQMDGFASAQQEEDERPLHARVYGSLPTRHSYAGLRSDPAWHTVVPVVSSSPIRPIPFVLGRSGPLSPLEDMDEPMLSVDDAASDGLFGTAHWTQGQGTMQIDSGSSPSNAFSQGRQSPSLLTRRLRE